MTNTANIKKEYNGDDEFRSHHPVDTSDSMDIDRYLRIEKLNCRTAVISIFNSGCVYSLLSTFIVGMVFATDKMRYFRRHLVFLLLSIPYVDIINILNIQLSHDAAYFVRFIPLARGALAMSIVLGYLRRTRFRVCFCRTCR